MGEYNNLPVIRRGAPGDLAEVAALQQVSREAAQWSVSDYLQYDFRVAVEGQRIAGFLVARRVAADESELLNLAVCPELRRKGVARALVTALLADAAGSVYLEVRESNAAARAFYKSMGFQEVSVRSTYYEDPPEPAIVMKFHSC